MAKFRSKSSEPVRVWVGTAKNGENYAGRYRTVDPDEVIEVHDELFDNYATGPWEPVDVPRKRTEVREQSASADEEESK